MGATNGKDETHEATPVPDNKQAETESVTEENDVEQKIDTPPKDAKEEMKEDKVDDDDDRVEESHTPPLLPNMKIKMQNTQENQNEKKQDKDNKIKRNQWDMFAEQDIFKADTEVRC